VALVRLQNGVDNERLTLRHLQHVYGGVDQRCAAVCEALRVSGFESEPREVLERVGT
jgi:hypothetical protein